MDAEKVNVCFTADGSYAQHLGVAIISLLSNSKTPERIIIHWLYDKVDAEQIELVKSIVVRYGASLILHEVLVDYSTYRLTHHFATPIYFRIDLPKMLDSLDKCLYLDCDIIVCNDICALFSIDIDKFYMAAIEEVDGRLNNARLSIPLKSKYFNAGVLMINLNLWRKAKISNLVHQFIENNPEKLEYPDQDALNAILFDKWLAIHPKWNVQPKMLSKLGYEYSDRNAIKEAIKQPAIIHYSTSSKPWHYRNNHPLKKKYYDYLKLSPWSNYIPGDRNFRNMVRRILIFSRLLRIGQEAI